jgi:Acetyltransferase (GNAT) domain
MSVEANERTTSTLFEESYWLDAAAPGAWHESEVVQDGKLIGRLPYVFKKKQGLRLITQPQFTPWLGPWIRPSGGKLTNELSHQHQVLEKLISQLPAYDIAVINCAPEIKNLMALHWAKFRLTTGYTHRLNDLTNEKILWDGLRDTVRRLCRKAEKITVITKHRTIGEFITLLEKTFQRQGRDISNTFATLERIDSVMAARNQRVIYTAEDAQGRLHSGVYIVYDDRHSVYLAGGGDPELRDSGGHALAMWHAIKESSARSKTFDFEGSSVPAIEYFVRGFGPEQTHRHSATRAQGLGKLWTAFQALKS